MSMSFPSSPLYRCATIRISLENSCYNDISNISVKDLTFSNLAGRYDLILDIRSMMCTVADVFSSDFKVASHVASPPFFLCQFNSTVLFSVLIFQPEDVLADCGGRCSKMDGGKGRISFVRILETAFLLFFAVAQLSSNDSLQGCYFRAQEIGSRDTLHFLSFSL